MGIFRFKQFSVEDTGCAMKTGTDAVLLGSWVTLPDEGSVLDIGCGSGIISLMIAQRNPKLKISAIDIDPGSANQARRNVENFPIKADIIVSCDDVVNFSQNSKSQFELIVCNPPFFQNSLRSNRESRNLARHNAGLDLKILSECVSKLLSPDGYFCLILPVEVFSSFRHHAAADGLFMSHLMMVKHKPDKPFVRSIARFSRVRHPDPQEDKLIIKNRDDSYTKDYLTLTREYYLFS